MLNKSAFPPKKSDFEEKMPIIKEEKLLLLHVDPKLVLVDYMNNHCLFHSNLKIHIVRICPLSQLVFVGLYGWKGPFSNFYL